MICNTNPEIIQGTEAALDPTLLGITHLSKILVMTIVHAHILGPIDVNTLYLVSPAFTQSLRFVAFHLLCREAPHIRCRSSVSTLREPLLPTIAKFLIFLLLFVSWASSTGPVPAPSRCSIFFRRIVERDVKQVFLVRSTGVCVLSFCNHKVSSSTPLYQLK